ncbi:glycosyltransferase family 2 protein [Butyrivibrio sp. YAB3001]|uniref:glycosyltransferase family 2 protein n=1 Tax=Butyrivibrio sp. YAB3001 TaxID=1520812 RepID=UPI0008F66CCB|nr:glycosyltransferase family 2 protein [Butyrivibrio sp. YAB3001]SFB94265.1 Glycosyltransferase, GT2 family [Butyrivibrio sp. YAB3001]
MTNTRKILIVIVSYNAKRYMQECIYSIRETLSSIDYKIAVVDNASSDGITEWLSEQSDILLTANKENIGFGPACNQAVKSTIGTEYEDYDVFLLNNDTQLTNGCVEKLINALYSSDDIGAVGAMSNYAGNRQQYDLDFPSTQDYVNWGNNLLVPESDRYMEKVRLNGFAMLIRRNVWDAVCGFDEDFAPGYYEDDAISIEIQKLGYRLILVRDSFIYHVGSASFVKTGTNRLSFEHHDLFIKKYGFDILNYVYPSGAVISQIPFSRDANFNVLHLGSKLGAELKAIRSFYHGGNVYGIENDKTLYEISRKTETVFQTIDEAFSSLPEHSINLLIIDSSYLERLSDNDIQRIQSLCAPDAVQINNLHQYDDFPFDDIRLIVWDEKSYSKPIADTLKPHGIMSLINKGPEIKDVVKATNIPSHCILGITDENYTIVPYITAHFSRLKENDPRHRNTALMKAFLQRYSLIKDSENASDFQTRLNLQISVHKDCQNHIDEILSLLDEEKHMYSPDLSIDKAHLTKMLKNDWNNYGYITVTDCFSDYGIVGFYCVNARENKLLAKTLSWSVKDLGIEEYLNQNNETSHQIENGIRVLIKSDLELHPIEDYLIGGNITTEYFSHANNIASAIYDSLPTKLYSSKYHIIIYSLLQYDYSKWESEDDTLLSKLLKTLENLATDTIGKPGIILLLGSETTFPSCSEKDNELADLYKEINPIITDFASEHAKIRTINVTDLIHNQSDFNGSINNFSTRVYSDITEQICLLINELA